MASNPSIRASDHDRDRTADLLREHHAAGRLDPVEFAERLDRTFTARTIDDLDKLTDDLPAIDLYPLPTASLPRNRVVRTGLPASAVSGLGQPRDSQLRVWRGSGRISGWVAAWGSWSAVMLVCLVLWTVNGNVWPLLWAGAVGAVMSGRAILGHRQLGGGGRGGGGGAGHTGAGQIGQVRHDEIEDPASDG